MKTFPSIMSKPSTTSVDELETDPPSSKSPQMVASEFVRNTSHPSGESISEIEERTGEKGREGRTRLGMVEVGDVSAAGAIVEVPSSRRYL
jgi:hypothetical protein